MEDWTSGIPVLKARWFDGASGWEAYLVKFNIVALALGPGREAWCAGGRCLLPRQEGLLSIPTRGMKRPGVGVIRKGPDVHQALAPDAASITNHPLSRPVCSATYSREEWDLAEEPVCQTSAAQKE